MQKERIQKMMLRKSTVREMATQEKQDHEILAKKAFSREMLTVRSL